MKINEVEQRVVAGKRISVRRERSYRNAFACLRRFTDEFPADAGIVNQWVKAMPVEYSDETVLTYWSAMKAAGSYVQKTMGREPDGRYRFLNPFEDADRPKKLKKQRRYESPESLREIMKACRGKVEILLVSVIIDSTCRIGDLVGLKGQDVLPDGFISRKGKTGELRYYCDYSLCSAMRALAGSGEEFVFKAVFVPGASADVGTLAKKVRRIMKRAGLTGKKLGPHTLRHSGASMIAKASKSAMVVQEKLQHSDFRTSQLYIHDAERALAKDAGVLGIMAVKAFEQKDLVPAVVDSNIIEAEDLTNQMFDDIPDGVGIRPLLKARDLFLLRTVMVEYARVYRGDSRVYQCQELLKRMLRKAVAKY